MKCQADIRDLPTDEPIICGLAAKHYRQCPNRKCGQEIGYCKDHGGDERAVEEMIKHIDTHKGAIE